jgi:hypothetical protein
MACSSLAARGDLMACDSPGNFALAPHDDGSAQNFDGAAAA